MNELEKWAQAQPTLSAIRGFLEWCDEQHIELASWLPSGHRMMPIIEGREDLLARYLEIDTKQLERERAALLKKAAKGAR